jgi:hypothetical protein
MNQRIKFTTINLLEENIGKNLLDFGLHNFFVDMTLEAQATKEKKIDKLNFIKIKAFCGLKDTIMKVKRQLSELEKIFANYICVYVYVYQIRV